VSSSYFAVYHALAKVVADALVGARASAGPNRAWVEVYRGLEHGRVKAMCKRARNVAFPNEIKDFADAFRQLQDARHRADCDPQERLTKEDAEFYAALAATSIGKLRAVPARDTVAFAAWVLVASKGADDARRKART
jgi:hypothetical protein